MSRKLVVELDRGMIEEEYREEAEVSADRAVTDEELKNYVFDVLMWHFQSAGAVRHREEEEAFDREEEERLRARVQKAIDRGDYQAAEVLSGLHFAFDETENDEDETGLSDVADGFYVLPKGADPETYEPDYGEYGEQMLREHPDIEV